MFKEFKQFVMRGNVVDLAVGVIIGSAFGKIVTSLVNDILMPPIGALLGSVDFTDLKLVIKQASDGAKPVTINYGIFINTVLDFLIVACCVFMVIKFLQGLKKKEQPAAATTKQCPECFSNIAIAAKRCAFCTSQL